MSSIICVKNITLGEKRGSPRLWLDGQMPERAGFAPGIKFSLVTDANGQRVVLRIADDGERTVSGKEKNGRQLPVIDINSAEALAVLRGYGTLRVIFLKNEIHVLPDAVEVRKRHRISRLQGELREGRLTVGSVSHGAGIASHAIHEGLADAGIRSELVFAVDIDSDALEVAARNNPAWSKDTIAIGMPLQTLALADRWTASKLPCPSLLEAGLPCTAASVAGRSKKGLAQAEDDGKAGHLVAAFIALIGQLNPAAILLENVKPYFNTASAAILRTQLKELGYVVHEKDLEGEEYAIEARPRRVMVAVTEGIEIDLAAMVAPPRKVQSIAEILDDVPEDDPSWSTMDYLKDKEIRDKAAGKGFAMSVVTGADTRVGTQGRGYQKNRSTEAKLAHPSKPGYMRLFTPAEHARIKGIPTKLIDGVDSKTKAHEYLGQSVIWGKFRHLGRFIGEALNRSFEAILPIDAKVAA